MTILLKKIAIFLLRLYQLIVSPLIGNNCRHMPSCSHYAIEAVTIHGAFKGSWLAIKRIFRCHPFTKPSLDPVPSKKLF